MLRIEIEITVAIRRVQLTLLQNRTILERKIERSDKTLLLSFNLKMVVVLILYGQGPQTVGPVSQSTYEMSLSNGKGKWCDVFYLASVVMLVVVLLRNLVYEQSEETTGNSLTADLSLFAQTTKIGGGSSLHWHVPRCFAVTA